LRADDLTVLAVALGSDPDDVAQHVAAVVGCTRAEAAALHDEVLRRRVLVPAAGLAIGAVAYASAVLAAPDTPAPLTRPPAAPLARAQLAVAVPDVSGAAAPRPTPAAAAAAPSAPAAATDAPAPAAASPAHVAPPPDDDAGGRNAGSSNATHDHDHDGDVVVSVPDGETFIEIGDALVVEAPGYEPLPPEDEPTP
jgi:hypothetical protein